MKEVLIRVRSYRGLFLAFMDALKLIAKPLDQLFPAQPTEFRDDFELTV